MENDRITSVEPKSSKNSDLEWPADVDLEPSTILGYNSLIREVGSIWTVKMCTEELESYQARIVKEDSSTALAMPGVFVLVLVLMLCALSLSPCPNRDFFPPVQLYKENPGVLTVCSFPLM